MAKRVAKKERKPRVPEGADAALESEIAAISTPKVFKRGEELFGSGALLDATREEIPNGLLLRARCGGSESEPYHVCAVLTERGAMHASCSCAYDYDGACKHVVALLLLQSRAPDAFAVLSPISEILEDLDRDDMARFLETSAARDFEIHTALSRFRLAKLSGEDEGNALTALPHANELRRRARGIIDGAMQNAINAWQWEEDDGHAPRRLIRALQKFLGDARIQAIATQSAADVSAAGSYHDAVLHEIVTGYHEDLHTLDEDGEVAAFAQECAEELQRCVENLDGDTQHDLQIDHWSQTLEEFLKTL